MSQLSFDHLLNLSLAFHTRRKTGEILRILDRGAAINHILEVRHPSNVTVKFCDNSLTLAPALQYWTDFLRYFGCTCVLPLSVRMASCPRPSGCYGCLRSVFPLSIQVDSLYIISQYLLVYVVPSFTYPVKLRDGSRLS